MTKKTGKEGCPGNTGRMPFELPRSRSGQGLPSDDFFFLLLTFYM
jgi:hypothetical protein